MLAISASCHSHLVDHANYNPKELGLDTHRSHGFMDYTDDSCMQVALDKAASWPVDRSSKNEVSIETLEVQHEGACSPAFFRKGNEIVTDNKDPDKAARADEAVSRCLPEVDDEVLVAFEHGDLRHPCLIASLWNPGEKPPERSR